MVVNCPYCNVDTGGNHEVDCPNRRMKESLTMSR